MKATLPLKVTDAQHRPQAVGLKTAPEFSKRIVSSASYMEENLVSALIPHGFESPPKLTHQTQTVP